MSGVNMRVISVVMAAITPVLMARAHRGLRTGGITVSTVAVLILLTLDAEPLQRVLLVSRGTY
jgi:hypothetical protein